MFPQSEIVMEQLELHKPPPPGPAKYINYPLLVSLVLLVVGLGLVLANLSTKKVSLVVKNASQDALLLHTLCDV